MSDGLLDPRTLRQIAADIGLQPTKKRGQNFVVDANTVRRIVALSSVSEGDVVLEVGPGLGSLTLGLLAVGCRVVAVEIDPLLADRLPRTVAERRPDLADRLTVLTADALRVQVLGDPQPDALVANLPYNVSVPVILHLLARFGSLTRGLVMVQAEVGDRLVAQPGSKVYGTPSVKLAWYAAARRVGTVPPGVFWPVPNVDSGLVEIVRRDPPSASVPRETVFSLVDAAFGQRRKMLRSGGLATMLRSPEDVLLAAGVDPTARPESLTVADFTRIAESAIASGRL
jgi:16S rRNA (adenine1518-N6/adenine1519-N6)-dimethyltransferase